MSENKNFHFISTLKIFLRIKVNYYQFLELKKQEFQEGKLMSLNISMISMFNLNIKLRNIGIFSYFKLSWYALHGNLFEKKIWQPVYAWIGTS